MWNRWHAEKRETLGSAFSGEFWDSFSRKLFSQYPNAFILITENPQLSHMTLAQSKAMIMGHFWRSTRKTTRSSSGSYRQRNLCFSWIQSQELLDTVRKMRWRRGVQDLYPCVNMMKRIRVKDDTYRNHVEQLRSWEDFGLKILKSAWKLEGFEALQKSEDLEILKA